MIGANMTFLWQMPGGIDAKSPCASGPASLSQAQSELGSNCVGEVTASMHKHADMGVSTPVPAFFVFGSIFRPLVSAQTERSGGACFPQNCR